MPRQLPHHSGEFAEHAGELSEHFRKFSEMARMLAGMPGELARQIVERDNVIPELFREADVCYQKLEKQPVKVRRFPGLLPAFAANIYML